MVQGRSGSGNVVPLMVRVPEDLRERIKSAAEANGRSQNSEIVATLEREYPAPKPELDQVRILMGLYEQAQRYMEERSTLMNEIEVSDPAATSHLWDRYHAATKAYQEMWDEAERLRKLLDIPEE